METKTLDLHPAAYARLLQATVELDGSNNPVAALVERTDWNGWMMPLVTVAGFFRSLAGSQPNVHFNSAIVSWYNEAGGELYHAPLVRDPEGRVWVDLRDAGMCWTPALCSICHGDLVVRVLGTTEMLPCPDCNGTGDGGEFDFYRRLAEERRWMIVRSLI